MQDDKPYFVPDDLAKTSIGKGTRYIKFGPGIEKAIAEGKMNRKEREETFRSMGVIVEK